MVRACAHMPKAEGTGRSLTTDNHTSTHTHTHTCTYTHIHNMQHTHMHTYYVHTLTNTLHTYPHTHPYTLLCADAHRHWTGFHVGGSTAAYVLAYAVYYFFARTK
jgi:hypothetical protein